MLGLYLHIPFCQSLCSYCNFNRGLFDADLKDRYVSALRQEIEEAGDGREADTVFFGGGTPSLLDPGEVHEILSACRQAYDLSPDAEVTLETNPETVTVEKMNGFRAAGINRISFGVQSFDDDELDRLERRHSAGRAIEAFGVARAAGFDNISLDLMLWLPGQSSAVVATHRRVRRRALARPPVHVPARALPERPTEGDDGPLPGQRPRALVADAR